MLSEANCEIKTAERHADLHLITVQNQTDSPLLRLPAELRNNIYTLVCDTVIVTAKAGSRTVHATGSGASLQLVCRQIRGESSHCVETPTTLRTVGYAGHSTYSRLIGNKRCAVLLMIEIYDWSYFVLRCAVEQVHYRARAGLDWNDQGLVLDMFPSVQRLIIFGGLTIDQDKRMAIPELLRTMFGKPELEVLFR